jgi:hypothetical protein
MTAHQRLERLIADCERVSGNLKTLNPDHDLLKFDGENCSNEELDQKVDLLMREFGPEGYNSHLPTDEEMGFAFYALLQALQTAIVIEKARLGLFKPI